MVLEESSFGAALEELGALPEDVVVVTVPEGELVGPALEPTPESRLVFGLEGDSEPIGRLGPFDPIGPFGPRGPF